MLYFWWTLLIVKRKHTRFDTEINSMVTTPSHRNPFHLTSCCFLIVVTVISFIAYIPPVFVYKSCESSQQTEHLTNIESSINNSKVVLKKIKTLFVPSTPVLYWTDVTYGTFGTFLLVRCSIWSSDFNENKQYKAITISRLIHLLITNIINTPLLFYWFITPTNSIIFSIYTWCIKSKKYELDRKSNVIRSFRNTPGCSDTRHFTHAKWYYNDDNRQIHHHYPMVLYYKYWFIFAILFPLSLVIITYDIATGVRASKENDSHSDTEKTHQISVTNSE